jgi:hypothetical protein
VAPAWSDPLSHTPVSEVVVWASSSSFVHVTVVPTATVSTFGEKVSSDVAEMSAVSPDMSGSV